MTKWHQFLKDYKNRVCKFNISEASEEYRKNQLSNTKMLNKVKKYDNIMENYKSEKESAMKDNIQSFLKEKKKELEMAKSLNKGLIHKSNQYDNIMKNSPLIDEVITSPKIIKKINKKLKNKIKKTDVIIPKELWSTVIETSSVPIKFEMGQNKIFERPKDMQSISYEELPTKIQESFIYINKRRGDKQYVKDVKDRIVKIEGLKKGNIQSDDMIIVPKKTWAIMVSEMKPTEKLKSNIIIPPESKVFYQYDENKKLIKDISRLALKSGYRLKDKVSIPDHLLPDGIKYGVYGRIGDTDLGVTNLFDFDNMLYHYKWKDTSKYSIEMIKPDVKQRKPKKHVLTKKEEADLIRAAEELDIKYMSPIS